MKAEEINKILTLAEDKYSVSELCDILEISWAELWEYDFSLHDIFTDYISRIKELIDYE